MGNTKNTYGKPVFDDVYSFPQDTQDAVDFADEFANVRVGTSAERQSLPSGKQRPGMLWSETDTGMVYRSDGAGAWTIPGLRAVFSAASNTSVPNSTPTVIDLDDPGNLPAGITWNESAKEITFGRPGRYRLWAAGRWQTNGTGYRVLQLQHNGNPLTGRSSIPAISGIEMMQNAFGVITASAGDKVNLVGIHTVGVAIEFRGAQLTVEAF